MNLYAIVTNNSRISQSPDERFNLHFVPGGLESIYDAISEKLQNGYRLISSPLPANVPLIRSPVRSIILQKAEKRFDVDGLLMLEKARERTQTLGINQDPKVVADLEMIDRDQLKRAIAQLEAVLV